MEVHEEGKKFIRIGNRIRNRNQQSLYVIMYLCKRRSG